MIYFSVYLLILFAWKWKECYIAFLLVFSSVESWYDLLGNGVFGFSLWQENPEAAQFQFKEIQFAEELDTIFNGAIYVGEEVPSNQHVEDDDNLTASTLQIENLGIVQPERITEHPREAVPVESISAAITQKNVLRAPLTQQTRWLIALENASIVSMGWRN